MLLSPSVGDFDVAALIACKRAKDGTFLSVLKMKQGNVDAMSRSGWTKVSWYGHRVEIMSLNTNNRYLYHKVDNKFNIFLCNDNVIYFGLITVRYSSFHLSFVLITYQLQVNTNTAILIKMK